MTRAINKWIYRCLGWLLLGALALAWLIAYGLDRHTGYGTLDLRLTWNHEPFLPPTPAAASASLKVRGRSLPLELGKPLRLRPGPAPVELTLDGFYDGSAVAGVRKNTSVVLDLPLRAKPGTISLRNPIPDATINGTPCGAIWTFPNAEIGRDYTFDAAAPGYETNHLHLRIPHPGEDLVADLVLRPLIGSLAIKLIPIEGTALFLDGVARDASTQAPVRAGVHSLTATNPDYYPFARSFEVVAHATNTAEVLLHPKPASITIEVTPTVDFQVKDSHDQTLLVREDTVYPPPGETSLTLVAKRYTPVRRKFLLEPNRPYSWKVRLDREGLAEFEKTKGRFRLLTTNPEIAPQLDKLGGLDWKTIRAVEFDTEDLVHGGHQYADAYTKLTELVQSLPERGRAWTNEVRAANAIDYWLLIGELAKAANELNQYTARFGPKSDFERWFGATTGKIQSWQDEMEHKRRYLK